MKTCLLFVLIAGLSLQSFGQAAQTPKSDDQPIKVNTLLLDLPVIASDQNGRYVAGLKKENFSVIQDGVSQEIEYFVDEKAPMNVAILIDTSISTRDVLKNIKTAAHDFVKIFRPEDRGMIVTFDNQTKILADFTSDQRSLDAAIDQAKMAKGLGSDMQDAINDLVTGQFAAIKGRKAIIVLTDGEVLGRISNRDLLHTLAEADVLIYPVIYQTKDNLPSKFLSFMSALAVDTGGRLYRNDSEDFSKSFQAIADELKNQYLIGFYPQNFDDGKPHRIMVETNPKGIIVRTKHNMLVPPAK